MLRNSKEDTSKLVDAVVSNKNLEIVALKHRLDSFVVKNPSQRGTLPRAAAASTIEALVGAVWLDSGRDFVAVQSVIDMLGIDEHVRAVTED